MPHIYISAVVNGIKPGKSRIQIVLLMGFDESAGWDKVCTYCVLPNGSSDVIVVDIMTVELFLTNLTN